MTETTPSAEIITPVAFSDALSERYLAYALSTITSRSLPDVRDGLKPVHRRLLYAMLQLKLDPNSGFKKCARVVGDVIGKYHPHGDTAVYDAMVRMAQSFSLRYPLVEGQGNFGSIDGDNAAAMRYTEARLTGVALALLQDLSMDTVEFHPTYDNSDEEPDVLPAAFPNLLANGSEGIAVGMATSIPPHNAEELCDALLYLLKSPNATTEKLLQFIQGPDFPTGGVLAQSQADIIKAYDTGKGGFRVRARWEKEDLSNGQYQIVITEIPYQVNKSKLIEKMADQFKDKKLVLLGNIRDESAEDIRLILEPKSRNVDPDMLMESLFKLTDLETRVSLNLNVLDANHRPGVMSLQQVLNSFLAHRFDVLQRKSRFRLGKIAHRLEILEGLLIAYANLDDIIAIIREEDHPKPVLMQRFALTDTQAEAILNMRLRQLRKLEEVEIQTEHEGLSAEKAELEALLADDDLQRKAIGLQLREVKKQFGKNTEIGARRTSITDAPADVVVSIEAFVEKEPITLLCSQLGWMRALKGHTPNLENTKYREGDAERFVLKAYTTDKLVLFSSSGRFFTIPADKIPGGKGHGESASILVDLPQEDEIVALMVYDAEATLLVASSIGKGFVVPMSDVMAQTKSGKQVLNLPKGATAKLCVPAEGDMIALVGTNRRLLVFPLAELPVMKRGQGVQLQRYRDATLSDAKIFTAAEGLSWKLGDRTRLETNLIEWEGKRGHTGRMPPSGFPKDNSFGGG